MTGWQNADGRGLVKLLDGGFFLVSLSEGEKNKTRARNAHAQRVQIFASGGPSPGEVLPRLGPTGAPGHLAADAADLRALQGSGQVFRLRREKWMEYDRAPNFPTWGDFDTKLWL